MILNVLVGEQRYPVKVPEAMLEEAAEMFKKMDNDMDRGWQMSRTWVDKLGNEQRCQVVADRLLTAVENDNAQMGSLMAAYILKKMPGVHTVDVDLEGEISETRFLLK